MAKEPRITVISGYYNREDYVDSSIRSLIEQDYSNYDIVIFDDASTDGTYEKLKYFEDNFNFVRVIRHETNIGFVQGLMNILSVIDSEYVAIHGSGDISHPTRLRRQLDYLDVNPEVGIVSSLTETTGFKTIKNSHGDSSIVVTTEELIASNPVAHGASMFRKRIYEEVGGYRNFFTFGQDRDLWLRMSLVSEVHLIPEVLYTLNKPENTVSRDLRKIVIQKILTSFSSQQISVRMERGFDFIDIFGDKAAFFYNPKKSLRITNILLIFQFYQEKKNNLDFLIEVSKLIDSGMVNRSFLKIIQVSYSNKGLRLFINRILHFKLKNFNISDYIDVSSNKTN